MPKILPQETYLSEIEDICSSKGYIFHGFAGTYKGVLTKLTLECPKHSQVWNKTTISDFRRGNGCTPCGRESTKQHLVQTNEAHISRFMATGKFNDVTEFWRSNKVTNKGVQSYWNYTCAKCSVDEFVQKGLCSGVFESYSGSLQNGRKSCRCSSTTAFTQRQQEYRINLELSEDDPYKFSSWVGQYVGRSSYFWMTCDKHANWKTTYGDLVGGHRCPSCASSGYDSGKDGSLYVILAESAGGRSFTGYGITNVPESRLQQHKSSLAKAGFTIKDYYTIGTAGVRAPVVENLIKKKFTRHSQNITGFVTEATLPEHFLDVVEFIKEHLEESHGCTTPPQGRED